MLFPSGVRLDWSRSVVTRATLCLFQSAPTDAPNLECNNLLPFQTQHTKALTGDGKVFISNYINHKDTEHTKDLDI